MDREVGNALGEPEEKRNNPLNVWTVAEWIARIGRPKPSWGGGSAGAIAAAQGYALVGKVAAVVGGSPEPWLGKAAELVELAATDERAYAEMVKDKGCAKVGASVEVSRRIVELADEGIWAIGKMAADVKRVLQADLFTASYLLYAGASSAVINMRTNLAQCPCVKEFAPVLQWGEEVKNRIEAQLAQPGWGP